MKATDQLKKEHESILEMLEIMNRIGTSENEVNAGHVERIVDLVRIFADKSHHVKEEGILFPELKKVGQNIVLSE